MSPRRRLRARHLGAGVLAVWEFLPAGVALIAGVFLVWAGVPVKVWGFCLLVGLGLAVIGWLRLSWWLGPR